MIAPPSPPKPVRRKNANAKAAAKPSKKARRRILDEDDEFNGGTTVSASNEEKPVKLPTNVIYLDKKNSESMPMWNDVIDRSEIVKCVSHRENVTLLAPLPITADRPAEKAQLIGYAAQTFNIQDFSGSMSSCITGTILRR